MMDHFLNSTQTIDDNVKLMNERLKRIERIVTDLSKENMYNFISYLNNLLNMFIANFRTVYIKINEIETALALSKVSILHKSIIDSNELLLILQEISKYNSFMYSVTEQNLINIEETLSVKTYLKNDEIRFIIDVPLVINRTYNLFKLYPLPISRDSETFAIIPEYPFLLVEGTTYSPTAHQCREIAANEYLCARDDLIPYAPTTCIEQLMEYQHNLSLCSPRRVISEDLKIQKIAPDSWILYSKHDKILTQTCGSDVIRENILGTYLLTVPNVCDVSIDDVIINGQHRHQVEIGYKPVPLITLPAVQQLQQKQLAADAEPVDLQRVNLDDVQHLNYLLKKSVKSDKSENGQFSVEIQSVSLATILLYIVLIVCVSYVVYVRFKNVIIRRPDREQIENEPQPPVLLLSR